MLKRVVDILAALAGLIVLSPLLIGLAVAVRLESRGPSLHWSRRVGRDNLIFRMPKFRSMRMGAPDVATHLLEDPALWVTPLGGVMRRTSLDELPQLFSVLVGHMSLVGPRPALFNQDDLIALRTASGAHRLRPGLTGWAQIHGRDELPVVEKAKFDAEYLERMSLLMDLRIVWATAFSLTRGVGVSH